MDIKVTNKVRSTLDAFRLTVENWVSWREKFLKGTGYIATEQILQDRLNEDLNKTLCTIDLEIDHCHAANTDIYYLDRYGEIFVKITDMNGQWKVFGDDAQLYFGINLKTLNVVTNATTLLARMPSTIKSRVEITFQYIVDHVNDWEYKLRQKVTDMQNAIYQYEFEGKKLKE